MEVSDRFDLRGHVGGVVENPLLWKPLSIIPVSGWDRATRGWRPTGGRSVLRFWHRGPEASDLVLDLRNRSAKPSIRVYDLDIELNGHKLGSWQVKPGRFQDRISVPPGVLGVTNQLELGFSPALELDPEYGHPISLLGVGLSGPGNPGRRRNKDSVEIDAEAKAVRLFGSGSYVVPLSGSEVGGRVSFDLRYSGNNLASASLELMESDGTTHLLDSLSLESGSRRSMTGSLKGFELEGAALLLHGELPPGDGQLEIGNPVSEPAAWSGRDLAAVRVPLTTSPDQPPDGQSPDGQSPDVILIILDAARGDRFPGWDYKRQTMPNIERLATEAVVFRNAFAECPTTSCSIPALITGVSLLAGGDVGRGRQMSTELTTLAEYLSRIGYRTVGFSATPNNSAARNMHQGFDSFHELWGRDNPDHGPFNLSRLAIEVLRSQPPDQPLYLQLHYLPPHQPYSPGSEYDRFTDKSYSGPIVPRMSLKKYSLGEAALGPSDLAQLIALYDGNMLRADAAVGELLSAMRQTDRYENSIIIVTSDHGEAFMEHGYQGHNTTLFDEMLHVPLIVRLPERQRPSRVDPTQLTSLLDVVPTVLGRLNLNPSREVDGWDLLGVNALSASGRTLVARTSHPDQPMISVRTRHWKSISWPKHQVQMLFDLVSDPRERENRVGDNPLIFTNLGLVARERLLRARARGLEGDDVTLDPEAEEALRALGYLD